MEKYTYEFVKELKGHRFVLDEGDIKYIYCHLCGKKLYTPFYLCFEKQKAWCSKKCEEKARCWGNAEKPVHVHLNIVEMVTIPKHSSSAGNPKQ